MVRAGSPYFAPRSYWCVEATLRAAALPVTAYHVDVPTFGDWGFLLAADGSAPASTLLEPRVPGYSRAEWAGY